MEKKWKYSGEIALFLVVVFLIIQLVLGFQPTATGYAVINTSLDEERVATFKFDAEFKEWDRVSIVITNEDEEIYLYDFKLDLFSFFATSEKTITGDVIDGNEEGGNSGFLFWVFVVILISGIILATGGIAYFIKNKKNRSEDLKKSKELMELKNLENMYENVTNKLDTPDNKVSSEDLLEDDGENEEDYIFMVPESRVKPTHRVVKTKKNPHKKGEK